MIKSIQDRAAIKTMQMIYAYGELGELTGKVVFGARGPQINKTNKSFIKEKCCDK
jgi:hypothetical protein